MERICPFLAAGGDGRAVVDGYDPAHRCQATEPAEPIDREQQTGLCLEAAHRTCDRYVAAMRGRAGSAPWPAPAADATFVQTRLVLPVSAPRRHLMPAAVLGPAARRWAVGGALATVGVAAVASGVAGGLGSLVETDFPAASANASVAPMTTTAPAIGGPTSEESAMAEPTPVATATQTPVADATTSPTQTPGAVEQRTYVVQPGDTLNGIAIRFGTSVAALQQANGLAGSDVILVGQTLIIP